MTKGHQLDKIYAFFDFVYEYREHPAINNGKEPNCTRLLRQRLVQSMGGNKRITSKYAFDLLAKAWNFYLNGTPIKVLKVVDGEEIQFK